MSKQRVIVLAVTVQGLTASQAADKYGVSRQRVYQLLKRYRDGGLAAVEPRSSRPHHNPNALTDHQHQQITDLRRELTTQGLDAGPVSIAWHLHQQGQHAPSTSTIRRALLRAGLIKPEPKKRPRSSLRRFEADQPNECWQSDFTHWHLADHTDVEILNWLDDHSRYLIGCTAHHHVTGADVIATFTHNINEYGCPASTLTDNGMVYTTRLSGGRGGRNAFEHTLAALGITQKNGHPNHPQTQGKIERFHQTLKRWLDQQPPASTLTELQHQLDQFRQIYNTRRPHRAINNDTPATVYDAGIKATPEHQQPNTHYRIRHDHVDKNGKISLRHAGHMHHLGVGTHHAGTPVLIVTDDTTATVINTAHNTVVSTHTIDPDHAYWRNTQKDPGRWPGSSR